MVTSQAVRRVNRPFQSRNYKVIILKGGFYNPLHNYVGFSGNRRNTCARYTLVLVLIHNQKKKDEGNNLQKVIKIKVTIG